MKKIQDHYDKLCYLFFFFRRKKKNYLPKKKRMQNLSNSNANQNTASAKFFRIAEKLRILEDTLAQLQEACAHYASNLQGYGTTFQEEFNETQLGLRLLSGEILTQEEMALIAQGGPDVFLRSSNPTISELQKHDNRFNASTSRRWGFEEDYIDSSLAWAQEYLRQCRGYTRGITRLQQAFLSRRYAPGGSLAQQAKQHFFSTATQQTPSVQQLSPNQQF
jgi:hypothetical protein